MAERAAYVCRQVRERDEVGILDGRGAHVGNVWVGVKHRRSGVGAAVMAEVAQWCR